MLPEWYLIGSCIFQAILVMSIVLIAIVIAGTGKELRTRLGGIQHALEAIYDLIAGGSGPGRPLTSSKN